MKRNRFILDFEVFCSVCGEPLDVTEKNCSISVAPCPKCLEEEYQEGKNDNNIK